MNSRTLRSFLRISLVVAVLIELAWLVYFIVAGTLPSVSREIVLGDWETTLPFALPHYLDFLAAPIFVGALWILAKEGSQRLEPVGLKAFVAAWVILSICLGLFISIFAFFHAGLVIAALASVPITLICAFLVAIVLAFVVVFSACSMLATEWLGKKELNLLTLAKLDPEPKWLSWLQED